MGLDPRVEGGNVEQPLLPSERVGLTSLYAETRRGAVLEGLTSVPSRCLVPAPCGRDRHDREDDYLSDLGELLPPPLLFGLPLLAFGELVGDVDVHPLGHVVESATGRASLRFHPERGMRGDNVARRVGDDRKRETLWMNPRCYCAA